MKENREFNRLLGAVVAGTYASLEDNKLSAKDVVNYLPAFAAGEEGLKGLREFGKEARTATLADNEAAKAELRNQMGALPELDRYYVTEGLHGLQCILRYIAKEAYERGLEEGRAAALAAKA